MAGENPEDARTGAADEFLSKSKWQRFQVLIMGPLMNIALALVVMTFVLYQGDDVPAFQQQPMVVGSVAPDSVAAKTGIQPGDRVIAVGGVPTRTWDEFSMQIIPKAGREIRLTIDRNGQRIEQSIVPTGITKYEVGYIGVLPAVRPQVKEVIPGEPAQLAGLQRGDIVLGVNDEKPIEQQRVIELIRAHEGKPIAFHILRNGETMSITMVPRKFGDVPRIGATILQWEFRTVKPTFTEAIVLSAEKNWEWARLIVQTLIGLFTRETPMKQLMGPLAIADLSGDAAEAGWIQLFSLMAMISLNLGLLNLAPVPVLDGGHIMILALEGLSRRDFSMKVKEKMLLAGFVLLLMLMVTVIYNDLTRMQWFQRLMPW
jgi:regulator of sigma E protease